MNAASASREEGEPATEGFAPIARSDARILVLGSLPGVASVNAMQYYAHPQNAFWKIMRELWDIDGDYDDRCAQLVARRIAVWDVLASSVRPGSMDADIRPSTARPNDFRTFFEDHPGIRRICFNGKTAERLFRRLVARELSTPLPELASLPSTSPAYASMPFHRKLEIWRSMLLVS
ncbi:MAG: DNA-deoxyinosine glycosylase [Woeseiaceae bacterium]|nr:DNA-deoxyinosine glycosylase [Woeseiaceae bacterium]